MCHGKMIRGKIIETKKKEVGSAPPLELHGYILCNPLEMLINVVSISQGVYDGYAN